MRGLPRRWRAAERPRVALNRRRRHAQRPQGAEWLRYDVRSFWLTADPSTSPRAQVAFPARMSSYDLPVDRRYIDTVKAAMTMPRGALRNASGAHDFGLEWPADTIVRVKTGNGSVSGDRVGWLAGPTETPGRP